MRVSPIPFKLTPGKALRYATLPGVFPRLQALAGSLGFPYLAMLMATVMAHFGLLSRLHPYLSPANIGRFSIRQVLVEAAHNLGPGWENIDRKIIFFVLMCVVVILALQFLLAFGVLGISVAQAGGFSFFTPPSRDFDIALMTLDRVFGVPNLFGSCISTATNCSAMWPNGSPEPPSFPTAFQSGLHVMLRIYSESILYIAVGMFVYYMFALLGETARTGTPFGQRFDSFYAPLRLIICVAMLLPINYGLNFTQHMILNVAGWGSGLASNGWRIFNASLANALDMQSKNLVATPQIKDMSALLQYMVIAQTCRAGHKEQFNKDVEPFLVKSVLSKPAVGTSFADARSFYDDQHILIRFGLKDARLFSGYAANIAPVCGDVMMKLTDINQMGSKEVYTYYYNTVLSMWNAPALQNAGKAIFYANDSSPLTDPAGPAGAVPMWGPDPTTPSSAFMSTQRTQWQNAFQGVAKAARDSLVASNALSVDPKIGQMGWAAAGVWFNEIASKNGAFLSAIANVPEVSTFPMIMEDVKRIHDSSDGQESSGTNPYKLQLENGNIVNFANDHERVIATALAAAFEHVGASGAFRVEVAGTKETGNIILDSISMIFGLQGLFNMRDNADIHPFAQMTALGRGLVDYTIKFIMVGSVKALVEGVLKGTNNTSPLASGMISNTIFSIAALGMTAGFFLYYVIPFLPFMYFLFALLKWIIVIFEAIVCAPIWALAHFRLPSRADDEGLMPGAAMQGYYNIMEIFLRPIFTIFGLLASITIFSALVVVLNSIFDLVISNLGGFQGRTSAGAFSLLDVATYRGPIDQFAFTLIYAGIVYIMAVSSFKLIDLIPANIFRWMGSGVENIADRVGSGGDILNNEAVGTVYASSARVFTGKMPLGQTLNIRETAGLDDIFREAGRMLGGGGGGRPNITP